MIQLRLGQMAELNPTQKLLMLLLSSYANENGECFPSQKTLASILGVSRRSVISHLQRLEELGFLVSQQQARVDGGKTSKLYTVQFDKKPPPRKIKKVVELRTRKTTEEKLTDTSWADAGATAWDDGLDIPEGV